MTSTLNWIGGTVGGTGILTIPAGSTVNLSDSAAGRTLGRTLNNSGNVVWNGATAPGSLNINGTFNNIGSFDAQNDHALSGTGTFVNSGSFTKSAGAGTTTCSAAFNNNGTLTISSGRWR